MGVRRGAHLLADDAAQHGGHGIELAPSAEGQQLQYGLVHLVLQPRLLGQRRRGFRYRGGVSFVRRGRQPAVLRLGHAAQPRHQLGSREPNT